MERKVIGLASRTLVVSLPAPWTRKHQITKGDMLKVVQADGELKISPNLREEKTKIELDLRGMNSSLAWYYLNAAYVKGYNSLTIQFDQKLGNRKSIDFLNETVDRMIGVEIATRSNNSCLLKEIAMPKQEEYPTILRRLFYVLISMTKEASKLNSEQRKLFLLEEEVRVNKYSQLCFRMLNRGGKMPDFLIVNELEEISDILIKENLSKKELMDAHTMLVNFHTTYYNTSDLDKFHKLRSKTKGKVRLVADKMMSALSAKLMTP